MVGTTEREMLQDYVEAKEAFSIAEKAYDNAKTILEERESVLVTALMDKGAKATARWDGLGHFTLTKPKLYASYVKENEQEVFSLVTEQGQGSIIKNTIASASLSTFVKGLIEKGVQLPEYIRYWEKQSGTFYPEKVKV